MSAIVDHWTKHPGGAAEFDRIRKRAAKWMCLRCRADSLVDPLNPGNCPQCGTPYWSWRGVDTDCDLPDYMKAYLTADPNVSVRDREAVVRYEDGGWRWFIIRTLDAYPIAKGPPAATPEDAECAFHSLFAAFADGIIKPEIDRRLNDMGAMTKPDPRSRQIATLRDMFDKSKSQIEAALPRHIRADYMLRVAMTSIQTNPDLLNCEPKSVLSCVMQASQLGLVPDGIMGEAYLIPFNDRKGGVKRCTLIPGYRGLQELARRSGYITKIYARTVREGDRYEFEEGLTPTLTHSPAPEGSRGKAVAYYAVAHFRDRSVEPQFVWRWREDIEAHKKRFALARSSPWETDFDAMARKTVIRMLCNELPRARELQDLHSALEAEERSIMDVEWSPVAEADEPQEAATVATAPPTIKQAAKPKDKQADADRPSPEDAFAWFETTLGKCQAIDQVDEALNELEGEFAWLPAGVQDRIRERAAEIKEFIRSA